MNVFVILVDSPGYPGHEGRRLISLRCEDVLADLPEPARSAAYGTNWLLSRIEGRWTAAKEVSATQKVDSPAFTTIPARFLSAPEEVVINCPDRGHWAFDNEARACEAAWIRMPSGQQLPLMSYVGVTLDDIVGLTLRVFRVSTEHWSGMILPPSSCDLDDPIIRLAAASRADHSATAPFTSRASNPPAPMRRPFRHKLQFEDIVFAEAEIEVVVENRRVRVPLAVSCGAIETVKTAIARACAWDVWAVGTCEGAQIEIERVDGLDRLDEIFTSKWTDAQMVRIAADTRMRSVADLTECRNGTRERVDPRALVRDTRFRIPEERVRAFEHLFSLHDPRFEIHTRGAASFLVPVRAADGDGLLLAWEVTEPDHATYLFSPVGDEGLAVLLDWLSSPTPRRQELLGDADLKRSLGYVNRVWHADEDADLSRWKLDLRTYVASPSDGNVTSKSTVAGTARGHPPSISAP